MRVAEIYYNVILAGLLTETTEGEYHFKYDSEYCKKYPSQFITFTMPVQVEAYKSDRLFPFFEGLIPEGWLLEIAVKNWKINQNDRMGILLACCQNCIGAVSVKSIVKSDEE